MKSPFPGMDPFIEARHLWGDFHDNFIIDLQRAIQRQLSDRYVARISDRVFFETEDRDVELILRNRIQPDVEAVKKAVLHQPDRASRRRSRSPIHLFWRWTRGSNTKSAR